MQIALKYDVFTPKLHKTTAAAASHQTTTPQEMEEIFTDVKHFIKGKRDNRQQVPITSIKEQGTLILGLYFSSYKCIPCHKFLPQLINWYTRLTTKCLEKNKFEIVFVEVNRASDRDFDVMFDPMPWLALSYEDIGYADKLSNMFRVNGTPCLVLINPLTGRTVSYNACDYVEKFPNAENFPWPDISFVNALAGEYITRFDDFLSPKLIDLAKEDIVEHKIIALYFSDLDLQDTETLTGRLTDLCVKVNQRDPSLNFQIVYIVYCDNCYVFTEHVKNLPEKWLALPFDNDKQRSSLVGLYNVVAFPSFILLDTAEDKIIRRNAEALIKIDPEGIDFPWPTKIVELFDSEHSDIIQESPGLMWLTDGSLEQIRTAIDAMQPVATKEHEENLSTDKLWFYVANTTDELTSDLLEIIDIPSDNYPILALLDFENQTKFICEASQLNENTVANFVSDYKEKRLTGTDMNL